MDDKKPESSTALIEALAEAMAHPVRAKIMFRLSDDDEAFGAKALAGSIAEPVRSVRHHLRRLADLGLIEVVESRGRRGVNEKFYRPKVAPRLDDAQFERLDPEQVRAITVEIFRRIVADVTAALSADVFDLRPDSCHVRLSVPVDERGWSEVGGLCSAAFEEIERARAESARRLRASGGLPLAATAAILWFELPPRPFRPLSPAARLGPRTPPTVSPPALSSVAAMAAAMAHPVRARILSLLADEHRMDARRLAEGMSVPVRSVRYHLRRLLADGFVQTIEPGDGFDLTGFGLAAMPLLDVEEIAAMSSTRRRAIDIEIFRRTIVDVSRAIDAATFSRRSGFCEVRLPAVVDEQGWREIATISRRTYEAIERQKAAAAERLRHAGSGEILATAAVLWFGVPRRADR